ncbi:hypothetical protein V5799_005304 [Amblyomma americanum]|uniref:Core Histone H2A/H2B/H3 domain-containing protein n=1 Tax=Amblyomma americanum TaxID=6943 RepID=A0AAQ4DZM5_AMBAM
MVEAARAPRRRRTSCLQASGGPARPTTHGAAASGWLSSLSPRRRRQQRPSTQGTTRSFRKTARSRKEPKPSIESTKRKQPLEVSPSQEAAAKKAFPGRSEESQSSAESDYATPPSSVTGALQQASGLEGTRPWLRSPLESSTATPDKSPQKSLRHEESTADLRQRMSASPAPTSERGQSVRKSAHEPKSPEGPRRHDTSGPQPPETPRRALQEPSHHEKAASMPRRITRASAAAASRSVQGVEGSTPRAEPVRRRRERQINGSGAPAESSRKQDAQKKPVKKRTGYRVLQVIIREQKSTRCIIPRLPFARVVREILWKITGEEFKMQKIALQALHEASEAVIVALLEGSTILARHARRITVMNRDLAVLLAVIRSYGSLQRSLD